VDKNLTQGYFANAFSIIPKKALWGKLGFLRARQSGSPSFSHVGGFHLVQP
jgi:hypothetical protein